MRVATSTMAGVEPGDYVVVAREGGRARASPRWWSSPRRRPRVELVLSDGGFVTGRIVDEEGRPLAGRVRAEALEDRGLPSFGERPPGRATRRPTASSPSARCRSGTLGIGVSAPRHATRQSRSAAARGRTVEFGDVVSRPASRSVAGCADREGNGIDGASVRAQAAGGRARPGRGDETRRRAPSPSRGSKPGPYEVTRSRAGLRHGDTRRRRREEIRWSVVMEAGGQIAGTGGGRGGAAGRRRPLEAEGRRGGSDRPRRVLIRHRRGGRGALRAARRRRQGPTTWRPGPPGKARRRFRTCASSRASTTSVGRSRSGAGASCGGRSSTRRARESPGPPCTRSATRTPAPRTTRRRRTRRAPSRSAACRLAGSRCGTSTRRTRRARPPRSRWTPRRSPCRSRIVLLRGGRLEGRVRHRDGRPFGEGRVIVSSGTTFA